MAIKITNTTYDRKSISNHTDKDFTWNTQEFFLDKDTSCSPPSYRLWGHEYMENGKLGTVLVLDYFCDGESWASAIKFTEGYLTAICGKQDNK